MRILTIIVKALYPPPQPLKKAEKEEVDLKAVEADLSEALDWLNQWHPDGKNNTLAQEWIDWLDEVWDSCP